MIKLYFLKILWFFYNLFSKPNCQIISKFILLLCFFLVGPCALDYSKMKTQDHFWTDPPADELVQRHRLSTGVALMNSPSTPPLSRRPGLQV